MKDKLICENEKIDELRKYIAKCKEENCRKLKDKEHQINCALEEKRDLKKKVCELKQRLEELQSETAANKDAYKSVMKEVAEAECQLRQL